MSRLNSEDENDSEANSEDELVKNDKHNRIISEDQEDNILEQNIQRNGIDDNEQFNEIKIPTIDIVNASANNNLDIDGRLTDETIVFDCKMVKTSTKIGELATSWNGRTSAAELGLRRSRSWSAGPPDDGSSEVRLQRERLLRTQTRPKPTAVKYFTRRQRLTLASLALVDFMSFCSMSVMAPFYPREATSKGLSDTMCGLVFSFYAVIMFLSSPVFGEILPKVGAKVLFMSGMFVAGASNILFGTLVYIEDQTIFTTYCFVVRGFEALGASAYSTASYVFVVNTFPDTISSVLGILETFVGLGMSVGPAVGGLLYSIGGFGLPFYTLGVIMVAVAPINYFLLVDCDEYVASAKGGSISKLFRIPSIIITGLVIVVVSNTWAFLDPTLEPHLRQYELTTNQIGLIFLLFSALYGLFSPIWGYVADRVDNHWCMMVWGLFLSTLGLLLLGPCPFIPGLPSALWLDILALSILGVSVALTLLPTFQGVLTSSIEEGGCPKALATYSVVAGVWSCCYSLGEVLGPALGGAVAGRYGFPLCATLCAAACFIMAMVTLTFFALRESTKIANASMSFCESIPYTDTTWNSNVSSTHATSAPDLSLLSEESPLLPAKNAQCYGPDYVQTKKLNKERIKPYKNGSASIMDSVAYVLMFKFLTNTLVKMRKANAVHPEAPRLYQNYLFSSAKETASFLESRKKIKQNYSTFNDIVESYQSEIDKVKNNCDQDSNETYKEIVEVNVDTAEGQNLNNLEERRTRRSRRRFIDDYSLPKDVEYCNVVRVFDIENPWLPRPESVCLQGSLGHNTSEACEV